MGRLIDTARAGSVDLPAAGPIPNVHRLIEECSAAGLAPGEDAFMSFHVRFETRSDWERAGAAAQASWQVSAYSRAEGHMLRLSARSVLTESEVERLRAAIVELVADYDATWESFIVEATSEPNMWTTLAAQVPRPRAELPETSKSATVVRLPRAGGNDVA